MRRNDFEKQLSPLGMQLSGYGGECYFGEAKHCSVVLEPFASDEVERAKLAIRTTSEKERKAVVNTFLDAAGVVRTPEIKEALDGRELRVWTDSKCVTVAVLDDEFIVTVAR